MRGRTSRSASPTIASAAVAVALLVVLAVLLPGLGGRHDAAHAARSAPAADENVWLTDRRILNMAHGGGLREAPQGTLYAYKTAAARGANALEMDLHMTLDGHVVAIHDSTVDRTTDGTGCVVAKTLAELKQLDAAHTFVPGQGPVSGQPPEAYALRGIATGDVPPPPGFTANDFTIATLEEIFQAVPDAYMIMELKPTEVYQTHDCPAFLESLPPEQRPDLAKGVAELIEQYDMGDKVMVASFIDDLLHRFQSFAPDVDTSFPLAESLDVYLAFLAGDPLPNPNDHEAFQVPRSFGAITITQDIVEYARANGVAVHFWTINDPAEMTELLDWDVDGLITDVPQVLSALLDERGDPQPAVASVTDLAGDPDGRSQPGETVTFTASVSSAWPHPPVSGTVELRDGPSTVATAELVDGQATFDVAGLPVGTHELTAAYAGSGRVLPSTSGPVVHEVAAPATTVPTTTTSTAPPMADPGSPPPAPAPAPVAAAPPPAGGRAPATAGRSLPVTGGTLTLAGVAVVLLATGAVLVVVDRRRRASRTG